MALNVTTAAIASGANTAIAQPSLAQWDQGQILKIEGVELPESYQVEFSGGGTVRTVPMIGTAEGVQIPNKLLQSSHPITAHVVLHESATDRETEYWITIYVKPRQAPETVEIDPADISIIDQTIAAAQQAVATSTAQAEAAAGSAESAAASAEAATASETAAAGSASSAASSERSAGASAVEAGQAKTAAETAQGAAEAAQAAAEQAVTDAQAAGSQAVEAIDEAKTAGIQAIDAEAATQINQVGRAGATQIRQINELASNQMRSIETKTTQSIGAIEDARDAAIEDVQTEGQTQTAAAQAQAQAAASSASAAANSASAAAGSASAAATARTGAETAAASVSASAAQIAQNASDIADLNRQISESITPAIEEIETALDGKAPVIVNTASGDIASFSDGADGMPIKSLVANIEPVQDLHGYDYPWPEGGGKNKLPIQINTPQTLSGVTFTPNMDDDGNVVSITANGTATDIIRYRIADTAYGWSGLPSDSYVISKSGGSSGSFCFSLYNGQAHVVDVYGSDTSVSSAITRVVIYVWSGATFNNVVFKPMIRLATETDATFAPYSNICPISGHTGASVEQRGKNLISDNVWSLSGISRYTYGSGTNDLKNLINNLPSGTYTLSADMRVDAVGDSTKQWSFGFLGKGIAINSYLYATNPSIGSVYRPTVTFTRTDTNKITSLYVYAGPPSNSGDLSTVSKWQLELSASATDYEPYTGNQISVDWETEAGTVYGGTLDVTNGVLTVGYIVNDIKYLGWDYFPVSQGSLFRSVTLNPRILYDSVDFKSSAYKTVKASQRQNGTISCGSNGRVDIIDSRYTTVSDFVSAMGDEMVFYPIETPITYQLTESEISGILSTLYGTNNIWVDTGDIAECEYPADTKLYFDGKIAEAIAAALNA